MDRALVAILALGVNALAMGPWMAQGKWADILHRPAQAIRTIERKLNRQERSLTARRERGRLLLAMTLMGALVLGFIMYLIHWWVLDIILLTLLLPARPAWDHANAIAQALQQDDVAAARLVLSGTVWRHYALLDEHGVARAAIEILAICFAEKIVAPVIGYVLFGMPGFLVVKALYLLHENLCQPIGAQGGFGHPVAVLHAIASYLPSRLTALLWLPLPLFMPSTPPLPAMQDIATGIASKHTPEQLTLLGAASVLGLSLGGPTSVYTGGQWLGNESAKAGAADVKRGLHAYVLLHALLCVLLGFLV